MHIYINQLKVILRQKDMLFWIFAFPLLLATMFYFTLANIDAAAAVHDVYIAIVDDENYQNDFVFQDTAEAINDSEDEPLRFLIYRQIKP